ncbi:MAG: 2-C-methyl-D-erythritol 2,4-cyclodiphosphate synthase [candidate division Zixibacteria bacterium]|nr:2-C-methyl-D-erythritol 2,4-cyclodiphosphate synthase [candidate division Zixibacteria bacterium]
MSNLRIGHGFDFHCLAEGRRLIIGGVHIPYEKGLLGHSDADVLLHAVIDAVFGAVGLPDIGQHYPPSDASYRNIDSSVLVQDCLKQAVKAGLTEVINIDCVIMAEEPRLNEFIPAMKEKIASLLKMEVGRVGLKATTTEKMGFVGRGEGIAASAVCLITRNE